MVLLIKEWKFIIRTYIKQKKSLEIYIFYIYLNKVFLNILINFF